MELKSNQSKTLDYVICILALLALSLSLTLNFMLADATQSMSILFNGIFWYLKWVLIFILALKHFNRILLLLVIITLPWALNFDLPSLDGIMMVPEFSNFLFTNAIVSILDLVIIFGVIVNFFVKWKTIRIA